MNQWNTWKDEYSLSLVRPIDNKIHHLKIYSIGWGSTVITDKTQLSNLIKRELLSQKTCRKQQKSLPIHTRYNNNLCVYQNICINEVITIYIIL
ncbi:hypothetical protein DEO72_LG1g1427 [Vigna unguiculata]|uniref:Uncharacterized protein n=1 Tax=Vigna unguiculata TaxID=3917 RepID=A0A4D6KRM3_VIGUN|nr:hypothetical protein DEO72_LG1g1427 [Vigna unguiculata]